MTKSKLYISLELILLFIALPLLLLLPILLIIKISVALVGVVYIFWNLIKNKQLRKSSLLKLSVSKQWKSIVIKFSIMIIGSTLLMYFLNPENLFIVVRKNVLMWISVCFFYALFSVYPQELIYRTFFFYRYKTLFPNTTILIAVNAIMFSLAHSVMKNWLVLGLTLVGGLIFAITYNKSKSVMLTSLEHSLYGSWLFTLGMGEMLAFPMPQ
jgi:CAAX protease family protein